ncbi:MAG TPA: TlpA disulfide reductase family protein [Hanamia sp.]
MHTKNLLLLASLFCALQTFSQNNFTYSPEKPQAGDVITIHYTPSGTIANTTVSPTSIVYALGSKGQKTDDLLLKKTDNDYVGTLKTDTSENLVFFSFSVDNNFDNSSNNGYWIQLYKGDILKKGADLSLSRYYQSYGQNAGLEPANDKALNAMEDEFKRDPEAKKANLIAYARLYMQVNKDKGPDLIQKEIETQIKSGLKDESDYSNVQNLYTLAKLPEQAKLINDLVKEKFPNGKWKINETVNDFLREKDIAKKEQMLDGIILKIKNDSSWKYLASSLLDFESVIPSAYEEKQDWDGMQNAIKQYDIKGSQLASIYNNAAWEIQKTGKNLEQAGKMSATAVDFANKEWKNPTEKKSDYLPASQWEKSRADKYGMYADTYAMVMYRMGNYKKGFPYTEESAIKIAKGETADGNNTYALLAEKVLSPKKYVPQLEKFVKDGKATSDIKEILKRAYITKHESDKGYDDYIAVLEKDSYLKMVADLKKNILNETSPSFTLVDLKGNKVNIADLKNKVVVVDFWATWCGPCKASFPGMQKMVAKYNNDPDVKFVFVDTWETTDKKEKNATDFIASKKYDFHVLMDNDSKVVEQFKVSGIPTKFVIDKNGIIRFKAVGFDGSDDKLVGELTAMIDMVKTM